MSAPPIVSDVLTSDEAAVFLRLAVNRGAAPEDMAKAVRGVHRLVRERGLRPLKIGKAYFFTRAELERWTAAEVEAWAGDEDAEG